MMVKICGITNLDDALAAVEAGASAIGFNFYAPSPRYVPPESAAKISERLPGSITKVGVFVNESAAAVAKIAGEAGLDVAQLHGDEPPEAFPPGIRVWKAFRVGPGWSARELRLYPAEAFLLDASATGVYGGSGQSFDWTLARDTGRRVILAGGLDAGNVGGAIRIARPWGVDAASRLESAPGKKDHEKMRRFVAAARAAAAAGVS